MMTINTRFSIRSSGTLNAVFHRAAWTLLALTLLMFSAIGQAVTLSEDELLFASLLNDYRLENGKAAIDVTVSMTQVAQAHADDLYNYEPHNAAPECNLHSWSSNGDWTPMCYTADHSQAPNMWNKPDEITDGVYTGNGFEITGYSYSGSAESMLDVFISSTGHNDVILNTGIWDSYDPWAAMGVGITGGYYSIWFGGMVDPQGSALSAVPVPASAWLFVSGMLGLIGAARRRKV